MVGRVRRVVAVGVAVGLLGCSSPPVEVRPARSTGERRVAEPTTPPPTLGREEALDLVREGLALGGEEARARFERQP